jgi:outer membrane lipoprotein carrier protein
LLLLFPRPQPATFLRPAALCCLRLALGRLPSVLLLLLSAVGCLPSSSSGEVAVKEIVEKLQARYDSTAGFAADFTQEIESATLGEKVTSQGKVYFKKPGRMRWEFTSPDPQTVVSDGHFLWFYQPQQKQVLKTPLQQAFRSHTPISFLMGMGRIDQDFTVTLAGQTEEAYLLHFAPREAEKSLGDSLGNSPGNGQGGSLGVQVSSRMYDIIGVEIADPLGNLTRLYFTHIDREATLDEALFHFTVPPGVDIVEPLPTAD